MNQPSVRNLPPRICETCDRRSGYKARVQLKTLEKLVASVGWVHEINHTNNTSEHSDHFKLGVHLSPIYKSVYVEEDGEDLKDRKARSWSTMSTC